MDYSLGGQALVDYSLGGQALVDYSLGGQALVDEGCAGIRDCTPLGATDVKPDGMLGSDITLCRAQQTECWAVI